MKTIKVKTKERPYPVLIGAGSVAGLMPHLKRLKGKGRLFVCYDAGFYALHGHELSRLFGEAFGLIELVLPSGEKSKSPHELNNIYSFWLSHKIARDDFVLACGGGVTSDLVGYAAATTMRGLSWGIVSTTLVGMVDAAIGGKTGINHRLGKNLIGIFRQPSLVWSDTRYLMTLPRREIICGLGEIVKYGGLIGDPMIEEIDRYLKAGSLYDEEMLTRLVIKAVAYKAGVVARDEHDQGERMVLNFGHTFAHAFETAAGRQLNHGEAVLLGLWAACDLSVRLKARRASALAPYMRLVESLMPHVKPCRMTEDAILEALLLDKKRSGFEPKFILLDRPGKPIMAKDIKLPIIRNVVTTLMEHWRTCGG